MVGRGWERAVREHRAALDAYAEFVGALPEGEWNRSPAEGAWTPAEVTEHLALSYDAALRELEGGASMAPRVSRLRQTLFRWLMLPHMLFHRSMPRVRSPRETRPGAAQSTASAGITRLREVALRAESVLARDGKARLTHPYFGPLDGSRSLRLAALHLEHHQRRLAAVLTRSSGPPSSGARRPS